MRIYLDVSCLNRPFDDHRQLRVRLESEAVISILERIEIGDWAQIASQISEIEVGAIQDVIRRRRVLRLLPHRSARIRLTKPLFGRAEELTNDGIKPADALHVAAAETSGADVFLTCDDRLLRRARQIKDRLRVVVENPVDWLKGMDHAPYA